MNRCGEGCLAQRLRLSSLAQPQGLGRIRNGVCDTELRTPAQEVEALYEGRWGNVRVRTLDVSKLVNSLTGLFSELKLPRHTLGQWKSRDQSRS